MRDAEAVRGPFLKASGVSFALYMRALELLWCGAGWFEGWLKAAPPAPGNCVEGRTGYCKKSRVALIWVCFRLV